MASHDWSDDDWYASLDDTDETNCTVTGTDETNKNKIEQDDVLSTETGSDNTHTTDTIDVQPMETQPDITHNSDKNDVLPTATEPDITQKTDKNDVLSKENVPDKTHTTDKNDILSKETVPDNAHNTDNNDVLCMETEPNNKVNLENVPATTSMPDNTNKIDKDVLTFVEQQVSSNKSSVDSDSEDNIPLKTLADLARKRKYHERDQSDSDGIEDDICDEDFEIEKEKLPSSDSDISDINIPIIEISKHRKKWFRRRTRPLKREATKTANNSLPVLQYSEQVSSFSQDMHEAKQKSKRQNKLYQLLKKSHESRLTNLLQSNQMERCQTTADGNCFFNSVSFQTRDTMTSDEERQKICQHLLQYEAHYSGYIRQNQDKTDEEKSHYFQMKVNELSKDGIWNNEIADVAPLAVANVFQVPICIYSSRLERPIVNVNPDINLEKPINSLDRIVLAYLAVPGFEHYDACIQLTCLTPQERNRTNRQPVTPVKQNEHDNDSINLNVATPRKQAQYMSPKQNKRSRKTKSNPASWQKNIRKNLRRMGKEYVAPISKQLVKAKSVKSQDCSKCKYKCSDKVNEEIREQLFQSFYDESMTFERKRDFICRHIIVKSTTNRFGKTYKDNCRSYFLPVDNVPQTVCKQFFLKTLDVSDKMIRCTLARKVNGSFQGTDKRGRKPPGNKTSIETIDYIKHHIDSFPVMESHYRRKDTQRHFLAQNLSINKMYELYKEKCLDEGNTPASHITYRRTFCSEYNYSFHKPKKDVCEQCNAYQEKERTNSLTPMDKEKQQEHIQSKERAREEKEKDKQMAKLDKNKFVATFDLEAVLYTPCSNVSQIFYKRKLACYNLSIYDLASKDGTCYMWDESQAARGSSEIGSCLITHLESLPSCVKHVVLYSDCCTGQNRNQYVAAGLLYAVNSDRCNVQTIEHKFLESGHTQMECDSMHAAIEHAKRRTSIFIPSQWDTVVHMARSKRPYVVVPMRFNQFYDLHLLAKEGYGNFKIDTDGSRVNWIKLRALKVERNATNMIQYKYSFDDTFKQIDVTKKLKRGEHRNQINICKKYTSKRPISVPKKKDLLSLCDSLVIPAIYRPFYEDLITSKKEEDCLPIPDVLEEEIDSD